MLVKSYQLSIVVCQFCAIIASSLLLDGETPYVQPSEDRHSPAVAAAPVPKQEERWAAICFVKDGHFGELAVTITTADKKKHTHLVHINTDDPATARDLLHYSLKQAGWDVIKQGNVAVLILGVDNQPIESYTNVRKLPPGHIWEPKISRANGVDLLHLTAE